MSWQMIRLSMKNVANMGVDMDHGGILAYFVILLETEEGKILRGGFPSGDPIERKPSYFWELCGSGVLSKLLIIIEDIPNFVLQALTEH